MCCLLVSLQSLLAQHKDFGAAFEPLRRKLSDLQVRVRAENGLQRDLPGKQAQLSRLQVRGLWGPSHLHSGAQLPSCGRNLQGSGGQARTLTVLEISLIISVEPLLIYVMIPSLSRAFSLQPLQTADSEPNRMTSCPFVYFKVPKSNIDICF